MPCIAMDPEEQEYVIDFADPTDAKGIQIVVRRYSRNTRNLENSKLDVGSVKFDNMKTLVILDNVFLPNGRIFMSGTADFSGMPVERFTGYHHQNCGGRRTGISNVLTQQITMSAPR